MEVSIEELLREFDGGRTRARTDSDRDIGHQRYAPSRDQGGILLCGAGGIE